MSLHEFTQDELQFAQEQLSELYFNDLPGSPQQPLAILLGGQPAAGKTRLFEYIDDANPNTTFVKINGDEYRRLHPRAAELDEEYGQDAPKYTQPFSNTLVEYLKAECLRLRCNFIIEGTMRSYAVIERTVGEVKAAGFRCEAHVLAVHRQDSLLGVFQRFESDKKRTGVGRFSPIQVHDEAYRQIPLNLAKADAEHLFDCIVVYTRQPDGSLAAGLERTADATETVDVAAEFDSLRQPLFDTVYYHQQWLALRESAVQRAEPNADYRVQLDEFVALFGQ